MTKTKLGSDWETVEVNFQDFRTRVICSFMMSTIVKFTPFSSNSLDVLSLNCCPVFPLFSTGFTVENELMKIRDFLTKIMRFSTLSGYIRRNSYNIVKLRIIRHCSPLNKKTLLLKMSLTNPRKVTVATGTSVT